MSNYNRSGNKWNINELLSLQREYELLELTIQEIALKHGRSVDAILFRLESEGFISSWSVARGFNTSPTVVENNQKQLNLTDSDSDNETTEMDCNDDDTYSDKNTETDDDSRDDMVDHLVNRVWNLESNVKDIASMIKKLFDNMVATNTSAKRAHLRNY